MRVREGERESRQALPAITPHDTQLLNVSDKMRLCSGTGKRAIVLLSFNYPLHLIQVQVEADKTLLYF